MKKVQYTLIIIDYQLNILIKLNIYLITFLCNSDKVKYIFNNIFMFPLI